MLQEAVKLNGVTITSAISACTTLKSLDRGLEIPSVAIKMGLINDVLVGNSLTDMHSKCGVLEAAWKVFDYAHQLLMKMQNSGVSPNVVTWNVMISGYIQNEYEDQAMDLFQRMEKEGKIKQNTAS
ncbi:pentatricopeptide repeat-containing protein [Quercus suber]|uniref:Pentatricopeptide repeat-containing protein n=1 Tax=Quercus suber TaxID=58331 RepID=A0AAW0K4X3_QUESU